MPILSGRNAAKYRLDYLYYEYPTNLFNQLVPHTFEPMYWMSTRSVCKPITDRLLLPTVFLDYYMCVKLNSKLTD